MTMDEDLIVIIDIEAERRGMSRATFIREAVIEKLERIKYERARKKTIETTK